MIETIEIKKLKLLERNPRSITKAQLEKCKDSLMRDPDFLDQRPILVNVIDGVYHVYAGNMRVRAAKKLGWKNIMCSVDHGLLEETIQRRIILDNAHFGVNDDDILAADYDIELLIDCGYTEESLQLDVAIDEKSIDVDESETAKKIKYCPHCNGEL
jgi:ParB-like chromosome segregation protein Spo0J